MKQLSASTSLAAEERPSSFHDEMFSLTDELSCLTIDLEAGHPYKQAFDEIVCYAEKARGRKIRSDELDVTEALASPFTPGGLLVLLLEPLENHPWDKGVEYVIETCPTLDALNEGFHIASKDELSLINGVSVLDLRPFIPKTQRSQRDEWNELYDLVFSAIEAKQPGVLLCMGDEAQKKLATRKKILPRGTILVNAMHPSHSVNFNSNDHKKREQLLHAIRDACDKLDGACNKLDGGISSPISIADLQPSLSASTATIEQFLGLLLQLCFPPPRLLPTDNLVKGKHQRYAFESWHHRCLSDEEKVPTSTECTEDLARALIIPCFRKLNTFLRRESWFQPVYQVTNWRDVCRFLAEELPRIRHACYILSGGEESPEDCDGSETHTRQPAVAGRIESSDVLRRVSEITEHCTLIWDRQPHPCRKSIHVGFV